MKLLECMLKYMHTEIILNFYTIPTTEHKHLHIVLRHKSRYCIRNMKNKTILEMHEINILLCVIQRVSLNETEKKLSYKLQ